MLIELDDKLN